MKRIYQIASVLLLFTSCQSNFEDPELKDQVELLENRVVRLEEQLQTLGTTIRASSYSNEKREENTIPKSTPVTPKASNESRVNSPVSSDYSEGSGRSTQTESSIQTERSTQIERSTQTERSTQRSSSSYSSSRCQATTRKGTQCKRMTRSGSYCWQHGG